MNIVRLGEKNGDCRTILRIGRDGFEARWMERQGGGCAVALRAAMGIAGLSRVDVRKRTADRERAFEGIVTEKYVGKCKKSTCILLGARSSL